MTAREPCDEEGCGRAARFCVQELGVKAYARFMCAGCAEEYRGYADSYDVTPLYPAPGKGPRR